MDDKFYKWKDLKTAVRTLLTVDKDRLGLKDAADGTPGYISLMIRQAVIDLQNFIPAYRIAHETLYYAKDFVGEGEALRAVLPPLANLRDAWVFDYDTNARFPVFSSFPWEKRFDLINQCVPMPVNYGWMSIDHSAYTFYLYPGITDNCVLSLFWDGNKTDFQDDEETPFDEQSTLVIADFVKGKIARDVKNDFAAFNSYFHPITGTYSVGRRNLYHAAKERLQALRHFKQVRGYVDGCAQSSAAATTDTKCVQRVFDYNGDPNGHIFAVPPAICIDGLNKITWVKDDAIPSNQGWH